MLCEWIDHFHVQMWSYIVSAFPMSRFCAVIGQFCIRLRSIHKLIQKQTNLSSAMQCPLAGTAVGYKYNWTLFEEWLKIKVGKNQGSKLDYHHALSFLPHLDCVIIKPQGLTKSIFICGDASYRCKHIELHLINYFAPIFSPQKFS